MPNNIQTIILSLLVAHLIGFCILLALLYSIENNYNSVLLASFVMPSYFYTLYKLFKR